MVQILERPPSFGESLTDRFVKGLGGGFESGLSLAEKLAGKKEKLQAARDKLTGKAHKDVDSFLKSQYGTEVFHDEDKRKITDAYVDLINKGYSQNDAHKLAYQMFNSSPGGRTKQNDASSRGLLERFADTFSHGKGQFEGESDEDRKKRQARGVFTKEEREQKEYPYALASLARKSPGQTLASLGIGALINPLESASSSLGSTLPNKWFGKEPHSTKTPLSDFLREKSGIPGLSEEGQNLSSAVETLGGFLPFERLINAFSGTARKVKGLNPYEMPSIEGPKKQIGSPGVSAGKKAAEETIPGVAEALNEEKGLVGRVSKEVSPSATESRLERMSPRERLFETKQQQKILQTQLKLFPKYAEEISKDAGEMAARREKILGPKALQTQAQKIDYYSRQLPMVQKDYEKAISRVRALENQLAKQPELVEQIKPLIEASTRQLEESEYLLKQTLNNARTGSSKVGFEEMRQAAQKKVLDIESKIGKGEEIELHLRDYNPEFVRQAKKLTRKKSLPSTHTDDYFTQVHDGYAQVYRDRLNKLDEEISKLAKTNSLSTFHQRNQLGKERDIIRKLLDHTEAENAIHRNKLALRQIHDRKMAQERLGQLKPTEGSPKVKEAAKNNIWSERIRSAKTPQEKVKMVEEAIEDISANDPSNGEQIREEGAKLNEWWRTKIGKRPEASAGGSGTPPPGEHPPKGPSSAGEEAAKGKGSKNPSSKEEKEQVSKTKEMLGRWKKDVDELVENFPRIWKSKLGKDLLIGIAGALYDDVTKDENRVSAGTLSSVVFGRRGAGGSGFRFLVNQATRNILKQIHVQRAANAYETKSPRWHEYSKSVQKKALERIRKED